MLFSSKIEVFFWSGFFVGILWFYWIAKSMIYYELAYLIPIILIAVGLVYAFMFLLCGILENIYFNAILFFLITLIAPFGFNWLDFRILFVESVFDVNYLTLALFFLSVVMFHELKKYYKILFIIPLVFMIDYNEKQINFLPLDIELVNTNINQNLKWSKENQQNLINQNLNLIENAIKAKKQLIILPESAFALFLNMQDNLTLELKQMSYEISIIAGSLYYDKNNYYNSTYVFENGNMQVFHKLILVPFGEKIPLPNFLVNLINDIFYNGAKDYSVANEVSDYYIKNIKIRNAICFEATKQKLYENNPKFLIALSNNAWFMPSTQAILQNKLLKLYSILNNTTIYHSTNASKSEIITPQKPFVKIDNLKNVIKL